MQMIDVIKKLQEIQGRSPEELGRAINSVAKLNTIAPTEQKVVEAKIEPATNSSYMVDVLSKLRELESRSPEMAHAIANATKMGTPVVAPVAEGIEIKTSGDDAILAQILKLAGMVNGVNSPDMAGGPGDLPGSPSMGGIGDIPHDHAMVPSSPDMPELPSVGSNLPSMDTLPDMDNTMDLDIDMGMDKDIPRGLNRDDNKSVGMSKGGPKAAIEDDANRPYTNSPHEMTKPINAAVPKGNDLARPKATFPKVAGGDNPTHVAVDFD
jgi:hypothetical protein